MKNTGITLIALVITIVVLLILSGISIGALTGYNSIISETSKAKSETDSLKEKEQVEIALVNSQDKKNIIDYNMLLSNLKKVFGDKAFIEKVDNGYVIVIGNNRYPVDINGKIDVAGNIGSGTINAFVEEDNIDTTKDVKFYGYKLLESEIGLAVYFKMPEEKIKSGNEKIVFTQNGTPTTVNINEDNITNEIINGEDYFYVKFTCSSIYMTDEIQYCSYDGDTKDSGDYTCTIKECGNVILGDEIDSKTERFVKSILNYGGKAQIQFNHNTSDLANEGITLDDSYVTAEYLKPYELKEIGNNQNHNFIQSLSCNNKIDLNIYVSGFEQSELSNYRIYLNNIEKTFNWYGRNGLNLAVQGFVQEVEDHSKMQTIVVKDLNGNIVSNELQYCVFSYCYKTINQGQSANADLCKSIVVYTEAYNEYKNQ